MQKVSAMSVTVRASGVSEAFYNGQRDRVVEAVRAEAAERIRQAKREVEIERERADINARNCNRFRAEKLAQMKRRPNIFRRCVDKIAAAYAWAWATTGYILLYAWAYIWAFTFGRAWVDILINWLERMKK